MTLRTPRTQALAYRIWAYATPREWDVTIPELAEEFRENDKVISAILLNAGWMHRIRKTQHAESSYGINGGRFLRSDAMLSDLHDWS